MKYQLFSSALFLAILLSLDICSAQEKRYPFEEITLDCPCPDFEWNNRGHRELKNISQSVNEMEIRLDVFAKWNDRMIITISGNKGKYQGYFYHKRTESIAMLETDSLIKYKGKWEKYNFKKFPITDANLDSAVKVLMASQITTLPNQKEIYKKGFISPYILSYKIDGKIRSFQFGAPGNPMREFPDEPVYQHYDTILKTLFKMINPMYSQIWKDVKLQEEKEERDTIFLKKPNAEGHSVYVDKGGRESPHFASLTNLEYTNADKAYLKDLKALQKYKKEPERPIDLGKLPHNWIQLHMYKGKFYLYSPSNGSPLRIALNDSTMIISAMERSVDLMNHVEQTGKNAYRVNVTKYNGQSRSFQIHLIHPARGIAVFEDTFEKGSYMLMVTAERAHLIPLVINYTPHHMEAEFAFDTPDFKKLLSNEQY